LVVSESLWSITLKVCNLCSEWIIYRELQIIGPQTVPLGVRIGE
jgi:hypothetical protein